ncbi:hypothetical protein B0F90DRAFT_1781249 [Multifurca ochricompacta]|uniref:Uncharacterized protein n=1 Tax=Multifurca ochricompacta TaxID=376703 RepID=A0AAD4QEU0_9AGAM|nr:hypothetical protein B0F90DRAFT_1781249 [Multifurca ochricompacta]
MSTYLSDSESPTLMGLSNLRPETSLRGSATYDEHDLKDLEEKLLEGLSNCRALEGTIREYFTSIKRNYRRVGRDTLRTSVPQIDDELAESLRVLAELEARLPAIRTQAAQVRQVYDSGRQKAEAVARDLRWLNRGWYERGYKVVFTSKSPVSWRWRATLRTLLAFTFIVAAWMFWVALLGVTRAHRQRLVWGERLPS